MFRRKDVILFEGGLNKVTGKPFRFLYEYGYAGINDKHILYEKDCCNTQNAVVASGDMIKLATEEDIKNYNWG